MRPADRSSSHIGRDLGVGERVRLPEVVVGLQQVGVVVEARLDEEVGDGRALLVVAAAPPDHVAGAVEPLGVRVVVVVGRRRTTYGLGERHRLGVEVDVVPARERAAPVEDDRLDRTHAGESIRGRRDPTKAVRAPTRPRHAPWRLSADELPTLVLARYRLIESASDQSEPSTGQGSTSSRSSASRSSTSAACHRRGSSRGRCRWTIAQASVGGPPRARALPLVRCHDHLRDLARAWVVARRSRPRRRRCWSRCCRPSPRPRRAPRRTGRSTRSTDRRKR